MATATSKFFDAEAVRAAVRQATTQSEALRAMGFIAHADNFRRLREACVRYGLEVPRRTAADIVESDPKLTAEVLAWALGIALTRSQAIALVGLSGSGKSRGRLQRVAEHHGIQLPPMGLAQNPFLTAKANIERLDDETVDTIIGGARTEYEALRRLGMRGAAAGYAWLRERMIARGLTLTAAGARPFTPNDEYFVLGERRRTYESKIRIRRDNLMPYDRCNECGIPEEWNGQPLSFHLDHINGDTADNRLENLRFLCPNCHSQTDTYCKPKQYRLAA